MSILVVHHPRDSWAAELVTTGLIRSFTTAQVQAAPLGSVSRLPAAAVLVNPDEDASRLLDSTADRSKVLLLGRLTEALAARLGLRPEQDSCLGKEEAAATVDPSQDVNLSRLAVCYNEGHPLGQASPLRRRHFCRFDFGDEWNNLGYGRITLDGGPWSFAGTFAFDGASPIAWLERDGGRLPLAYAAIQETRDSAILWFNRGVGPIDSLEWHLVEFFFAAYRPDDLVCLPSVSEIPAGYRGAACARLDCDEAVASADDLLHLYQSHQIPLSLAVKTSLPMRSRDRELLNETIAGGGAVVSHSVHHRPNWGGTYDSARADAEESRLWLEENLTAARPVRTAVSPFHQNPGFAVNALADAGYHGFVGGIIRNDPEYLLGRAGRVPSAQPALVSHSQQCMMHGDCYHRAGNRIDVYRESFENHVRAGAIFGYLDHPFSCRYQYGWHSEGERSQAHRELIDYFRSHDDIWYASLNQVVDFLRKRDAVLVDVAEDGRLHVACPASDDLPPLALRWKERTHVC